MDKPLTHKKYIIFDFDGTIADTMTMGLHISNKLCKKFGYKCVSIEEMAALRHKKTQEVLKSIQLSPLKLPLVARSFRKELNKNIYGLEPITGMKAVLLRLSEMGYHLVVATSNSKKNLIQFLENHQLTQCFQHTLSGITLFGKGKLIKSFIKKQQLQKSDIVLVGDETRDIEAAHGCGIPVVSVCWGFNTSDILAKQHPDHLVSSPNELMALFE